MAADPTPPPTELTAAQVVRSRVVQVAVALALQAAGLGLSGALVYNRTIERMHPLTSLLDEGRRAAAATAAVQASQLERLATLGPALLLLLLLLRLVRYRDPLEGLGLGGGWRGTGHLVLGFGGGVLAHVALLMTLAALAAPAGAVLRSVAFAVVQIAHNAGAFFDRAPAFLYGLPAFMALAYAAGRLVVSHAHLLATAGEVVPPAAAAALAALAFAATYLASERLTALAFVNLFLFGLLLADQRQRTKLFWGPLGLLGGWVLIGLWSGEAHQGLPSPASDSGLAALPTFLNGGAFGHEGGLAMTILLSGWLALRLRPRRVTDEPAPA